MREFPQNLRRASPPRLDDEFWPPGGLVTPNGHNIAAAERIAAMQTNIASAIQSPQSGRMIVRSGNDAQGELTNVDSRISDTLPSRGHTLAPMVRLLLLPARNYSGELSDRSQCRGAD
jgi:hypothetical protein